MLCLVYYKFTNCSPNSDLIITGCVCFYLSETYIKLDTSDPAAAYISDQAMSL